MNATTNAEQGFLEAIGAEPELAVHRECYADWLEEQGRDGEAEGWRWMLRAGRVPQYRPGRRAWFRDQGQFYQRDFYDLPPAVYDALAAGASSDFAGQWRHYPTRIEAEQDLARAYGRVWEEGGAERL